MFALCYYYDFLKCNSAGIGSSITLRQLENATPRTSATQRVCHTSTIITPAIATYQRSALLMFNSPEALSTQFSGALGGASSSIHLEENSEDDEASTLWTSSVLKKRRKKMNKHKYKKRKRRDRYKTKLK